MPFSHTKILLLFIIHLTVFADNFEEECYIDKTYKLISKKVLDSSNYLDNSINSIITSSDTNTTSNKIKKNVNKEKSVDSFFRTKKFTDETDETYISVKLNSLLYSKDANKFNIGVNARIPLSKSSKRYNLFINGLQEDDIDKLITDQFNKQVKTEIGINYFAPLFHQIKSRYSFGANGLNLFTIARYSIEKDFNSWNILSAQTFKYSLKNLFEEETNIYCDRHLSDFRLFRMTFSRGTQEKNAGMNYSLILEHYWVLSKNSALNLSQLFSGNTKYEYNTKIYEGVTNYTTSLSFRKNALRKWFFYGLTPSVNFNKQYDYRVNYGVNFYLEFYFGYLK